MFLRSYCCIFCISLENEMCKPSVFFFTIVDILFHPFLYKIIKPVIFIPTGNSDYTERKAKMAFNRRLPLKC